MKLAEALFVVHASPSEVATALMVVDVSTGVSTHDAPFREHAEVHDSPEYPKTQLRSLTAVGAAVVGAAVVGDAQAMRREIRAGKQRAINAGGAAL